MNSCDLVYYHFDKRCESCPFKPSTKVKKKAKEKVLFLDNLKPKDYEEVGICY